MSDASGKFVNAYLEVAVNQIHENTNSLLQLKAQLKVANDLVSEKETVISRLNQELETSKFQNAEMSSLQEKARQWETAHNAVMGKASHLDTALAQISDMKKIVLAKDEEIVRLKSEITTLKARKKQINKKNSKDDLVVEQTKPPVTTTTLLPNPDDDF